MLRPYPRSLRGPVRRGRPGGGDYRSHPRQTGHSQQAGVNRHKEQSVARVSGEAGEDGTCQPLARWLKFKTSLHWDHRQANARAGFATV